jgi:hypothetical protein
MVDNYKLTRFLTLSAPLPDQNLLRFPLRKISYAALDAVGEWVYTGYAVTTTTLKWTPWAQCLANTNDFCEALCVCEESEVTAVVASNVSVMALE